MRTSRRPYFVTIAIPNFTDLHRCFIWNELFIALSASIMFHNLCFFQLTSPENLCKRNWNFSNILSDEPQGRDTMQYYRKNKSLGVDKEPYKNHIIYVMQLSFIFVSPLHERSTQSCCHDRATGSGIRPEARG